MQNENDYDFDGSPDRVSKGVRANGKTMTYFNYQFTRKYYKLIIISDIPHVIQITDCESRDADYSVVSQTGEVII